MRKVQGDGFANTAPGTVDQSYFAGKGQGIHVEGIFFLSIFNAQLAKSKPDPGTTLQRLVALECEQPKQKGEIQAAEENQAENSDDNTGHD